MNRKSPPPNSPSPKQPPENNLRDVFLPAVETVPDRPLVRESSLLTPARVWTVMVILAAIGLGWLCFLGPLAAPLENTLNRIAAGLPTATTTPTLTLAATLTPLSTATQTPKPTRTPLPPTQTQPPASDTPAIPAESPTPVSPTPVSSVNGCTPASQVTLQDVGKTMCVTGKVLRISTKSGSFSIYIENPKDAFYFLSYDRTWNDLKEGNCIFATGEVSQLGSNPIMLLSYTVPLEYCP